MTTNQNPTEVFQKESPDIAVQASLGNSTAIYYHVPMAKAAGATRNEVKDAIMITLTICGLKGVTTCLPTALDVYDKVN